MTEKALRELLQLINQPAEPVKPFEMLSADVVTLHCESKERHLRLVRMPSTPHGRLFHTGMQSIGTTRARHRNNPQKACPCIGHVAKEYADLQPK